MAEVKVNIPDGLPLGGGIWEEPLTPHERNRLTAVAATFASDLGSAAGDIFELIGEEDEEPCAYLFGAGPGTGLSTRDLNNAKKVAVLRLLSAFQPSPVGYGITALPEAFYAALRQALEDREVSWSYTATVVGYGDEYTSFEATIGPSGLEGSCTTYAWDEDAGEYTTAADRGQSALSEMGNQLESDDDEEGQMEVGALVAAALEMSGCEFDSFGENQTFLIRALPDGTKVTAEIDISTSDEDSRIQIRQWNYDRPPLTPRNALSMAIKILNLNEELRAGAFGLWEYEDGRSVAYREIVDLGGATHDVASMAELLTQRLGSSLRVSTQHEAILWDDEFPNASHILV